MEKVKNFNWVCPKLICANVNDEILTCTKDLIDASRLQCGKCGAFNSISRLTVSEQENWQNAILSWQPENGIISLPHRYKEAVKILIEHNPLKNDHDAYLYEICLWALNKRDSKPKKQDYGLVSPVTAKDPCPDCGAPLQGAPGGGVRCSADGCNYWFCY